jgi:predicted amidohydrolase YtcJ
MALGGGIVLATGSNEEVLSFKGPDTRLIELGGRTVLPGINDSHAHACAYGASLPPLEIDVSFPNVRSVSDIRALVEQECSQKGEGVLVVGNGWDLGYIEEFAGGSRMPTRWDLDDVSPNNPVFLQDFSRHLAWVNTKWLQLAGVSDDSEAPIGGVIFRDPERGLTGLFAEGAQDLVLKALPVMDESRRVAAISSAVSEFNRLTVLVAKNNPPSNIKTKSQGLISDLDSNPDVPFGLPAFPGKNCPIAASFSICGVD